MVRKQPPGWEGALGRVYRLKVPEKDTWGWPATKRKRQDKNERDGHTVLSQKSERLAKSDLKGDRSRAAVGQAAVPFKE